MSVEISVIIPIYNVESYLKECVDSILSQTYSKYELILVDDGSTDNSGKICDDYASLDERVMVIHKKNGGASSARNVGLQRAQGDYIYFLDSDDYVDKTTLEKLIRAATDSNADLVFMDGISFTDELDCEIEKDKYMHLVHYDALSGRNSLKEQFINNDFFVLVQLLLIKKDLLLNHNISFYEGIVCEDELFTFYCFYYANTVIHVNERLLHRRMRAGSVMTSMSTEKRFLSVLLVFNDMIDHFGKASDDVLQLRFCMLAKGVNYLYFSLEEDIKIKYFNEYQSFRKVVRKNHGFGDVRLLEKSSFGLIRKYYRLKRKVLHK